MLTEKLGPAISGTVRTIVMLLAGAGMSILAQPATAQPPAAKAPYEIIDVKTSETALTGRVFGGRAEEVTVFVVGKTTKVFLYVTLKFDKAPTANTLQAIQVLDQKKKPVGQLFNYTVDKDDKKLVTLIYRNPATWELTETLQLKASGHTVPLEKKEPPTE